VVECSTASANRRDVSDIFISNLCPVGRAALAYGMVLAGVRCAGCGLLARFADGEVGQCCVGARGFASHWLLACRFTRRNPGIPWRVLTSSGDLISARGGRFTSVTLTAAVRTNCSTKSSGSGSAPLQVEAACSTSLVEESRSWASRTQWPDETPHAFVVVTEGNVLVLPRSFKRFARSGSKLYGPQRCAGARRFSHHAISESRSRQTSLLQ